jgi:hypothetical protein
MLKSLRVLPRAPLLIPAAIRLIVNGYDPLLKISSPRLISILFFSVSSSSGSLNGSDLVSHVGSLRGSHPMTRQLPISTHCLVRNSWRLACREMAFHVRDIKTICAIPTPTRRPSKTQIAQSAQSRDIDTGGSLLNPGTGNNPLDRVIHCAVPSCSKTDSRRSHKLLPDRCRYGQSKGQCSSQPMR